ncbi:sensor histidine kinase [Runella zeae]|uniref:sensor histidine kinase n=1 Tax=Runella zeae TaxID=94255 RepID=UPI002357A94A|nr:HAMP domain-containing sensor histidine kinase [Runella zeae]
MKLLYKTTLNFFPAMAFILAVAGLSLYLLLRQEVTDEINEQLELQVEMIEEELAAGRNINFPLASVSEMPFSSAVSKRLGDTLIYDRLQDKKEGYYYLTITKKINQRNYRIMVMTSYIGWERYYKTIFISFLAVAFGITLMGVLLNYYSNHNLWKPFFLNLENLKQFSVSSSQPLQWHDSSVTEFKELQQSLRELTERSRREYFALREFTENASHEIQTPLGIIQSKLDRMSQLEVSEEMARYIVQAKSGVERLTKMNKNLLLLAKLDNEAFIEKQPIELKELLRKHLEQMDDLFIARKITLVINMTSLTVFANQYLCEVLLSNLLSNALRYSFSPSEVSIVLTSNQLIITNPGERLDFPEQGLFDRFTKGLSHTQGTGLGLAIVRQICVLNSWTISYLYQKGCHSFKVSFP